MVRAEAVGGLIRQAVNQIDIEAFEAELARGDDQVAGHFVRLDAVDGLLHFGLKILDAHAQAIEAEPAQAFRGARDW